MTGKVVGKPFERYHRLGRSNRLSRQSNYVSASKRCDLHKAWYRH